MAGRTKGALFHAHMGPSRRQVLTIHVLADKKEYWVQPASTKAVPDRNPPLTLDEGYHHPGFLAVDRFWSRPHSAEPGSKKTALFFDKKSNY